MAGAALPGVVNPPCTLDEEQEEDGEEDAGNLQPENPAGVDERAPDGFAEALGAAFCAGCRADAARDVRGRLLTDRLRRLRSSVAEDAGCNSHADADGTAYAVRLHKKKFSSVGGRFGGARIQM